MATFFLLAPVILLGLAISTFMVRRSSRLSAGLSLTWVQAFKVALGRGFVGIGTGLALGYLVGLVIRSGWITIEMLKENFLMVVPFSILCGIASFLAYRKILHAVSGRQISMLLAAKTLLIEISFYVGLFIVVVVTAVIGVTLYQWLTGSL